MTDIASLAFNIDSSQAAGATTVLNQMNQAAGNAAQAVERLRQSSQQAERNNDSLARSYRMLNEELRGQISIIDSLVSKVDLLGRGMTGLQGPLRELMQAQQQLSAVSKAFGTTSDGLEAFSRASRTVGLSSQETVGALERIRAALENITSEGRAARAVLSDYGVSLQGMGRGSEDQVLRQFAAQLSTFRDTARRSRDAQTVLGPLSIDSLTSLDEPAFRTEAQRARELREAGMSRDAMRTREAALTNIRQAERERQEYEDLRSEYGSVWDNAARPFGISVFQSQASEAAQLRARRNAGVVSSSENLSRYANNYGTLGRYAADFIGISPEIAQRNAEFRESGLYAANQLDIDQRYYREQAGGTIWGAPGRAFNYYARSFMNRVPGGYTATGQLSDTLRDPARTSEIIGENADLRSSSLLLGVNGSMGGLNRRNEAIALARQMGWEPGAGLDVNALGTLGDVLGPMGAGAGISPMMQDAIRGRFNVLDDTYLRQSGMARSDRNYVAGREMAGLAGGSLSGQRSRYEAEAELRLREQITDQKRAEKALNEEMEEYDRRMTERQERLNTTLRDQTSILEARNNSLRASISFGVDGETAGAIAQGAGAEEAARRGGPSALPRLQGAFAERLGGIAGSVLSARGTRDENNVVIGALGRGQSLSEANDLLRIYREQRQERQVMAEAEELRRRGDETAVQRARELLDAQREINRVLQEQVTTMAAMRARDGAAATRENTDYYFGLPPSQRGREMFIDEQVGRSIDPSLSPEDARYAGRRAGGNQAQSAVAGQIQSILTSRYGLSPGAAQGVIDNMFRESGLNPGAIERPDGGGGAGLVQWTGSRRADFSRRVGVDPSGASVEQQLEFMMHELSSNPRYSGLLEAARNPATSRSDFEGRFRTEYERPAARNNRPVFYTGPIDRSAYGELYDANQDRRTREATSRADIAIGGVDIGLAPRPADNLYAEAERLERLARINNDPDLMQQARVIRAQVDARLGGAIGGLGFQTNSAVGNALTLYGARQGHSSYAMAGIEAGLQARGEVDAGTIPAGAAGIRSSQIVLGRAASALGRAGADNQLRGERVEDMEALADAARRGSGAVEELRSRQEAGRRAAELYALAQEAAARGNAALSEKLKDAARDTENLSRKELEASRAQRFNAETRGLQDSTSDMEFSVGEGLFMGPGQLRVESARRNYDRRVSRGEASPEGRDAAVANAEMSVLADRVSQVRAGFLDMKSSGADALATIIMQGGTASDVMKRLASEVASSFIRRGANIAIDTGWDLAGKGLSAAAKAIGFFGAAQGEAFDGPIVPFAQGGVMDRVTDFAMGSARGRMGEAGPEAAVPLMRMADGRLGVAGGGGRGDTNINITLNGSGGPAGPADAERARLIADQVKKAVREANQAEMMDQMRLGGMLNPITG